MQEYLDYLAACQRARNTCGSGGCVYRGVPIRAGLGESALLGELERIDSEIDSE